MYTINEEKKNICYTPTSLAITTCLKWTISGALLWAPFLHQKSPKNTTFTTHKITIIPYLWFAQYHHKFRTQKTPSMSTIDELFSTLIFTSTLFDTLGECSFHVDSIHLLSIAFIHLKSVRKTIITRLLSVHAYWYPGDAFLPSTQLFYQVAYPLNLLAK